MDDFQSFDGYFPSKTDFTPPYPPISGHSVIAPSKFSLNTVSLCIDRRYWSFGYYHDWWVLYDCAKMMGGCIPSLSRLQEGPWPSSMPSSIPRSPAQGQGFNTDGLFHSRGMSARPSFWLPFPRMPTDISEHSLMIYRMVFTAVIHSRLSKQICGLAGSRFKGRVRQHADLLPKAESEFWFSQNMIAASTILGVWSPNFTGI